MAKNPAYLPSAVWTVGAMVDDQVLVQWSCQRCHAYGPVDPRAVAGKRGWSFSLVDKLSTCRKAGCGGQVHYYYSMGPATPYRPLVAARERADAARLATARGELDRLRSVYNDLARKAGAVPIPPHPWQLGGG